MSDKSSNRPSASSILHAPRAPRALLAGGLAAFAVALPQVAFAADRTWTGGGLLNNNWGNNSNWAGSGGISPLDSLFFGGTSGLTNNNNTAAGTQYNGLTFNSGAGAFVLGGNWIRLGGNVTNNSTATQTINFGMELVGADRTFNAANGKIAINGQISGSKGIVKTGSGTLALSGDNTYSGGTRLTSGTLEVHNFTALGGSANALTVDGGTLDIKVDRAFVGALSGTGGVITTSNSQFPPPKLVTTNAAGTTSTFSGSIRNPLMADFAVAKSGEGTLVLNGSNAFGRLDVEEGTLEYGRIDSLAYATYLSGGATLRAGVGGTVNSYVEVGSGAAAFDTQGFNVTLTDFNGESESGGTLVKKGDGVLEISGALNDFDGGFSVDAGRLTISSDQSGRLLNGGVAVNGGATFDMAGAGSLALNGLTANGQVYVNSTGATTVFGTLDGSGVITGNVLSAGILGGTVPGTLSFEGNVTVVDQHGTSVANSFDIYGNLEYREDTVLERSPQVGWALSGNSVLSDFTRTRVFGDLAFNSGTGLLLAFDGAGSTVNWGSEMWATSRSWTIYQVDGTTTGFGNLMLFNWDYQDASGNFLSSIRAGAGFSIELADNGRDVVLNYTVVPAPGALALLALAGLAGGRRRRGCRV